MGGAQDDSNECNENDRFILPDVKSYFSDLNLDGTISKCEKEKKNELTTLFKVAYPYVSDSSVVLQVQWVKITPSSYRMRYDCSS